LPPLFDDKINHLRKLIVLSFITLDGVIQSPGAPEEDTSGGFKYGGWLVPHSDEFVGKIIEKQMSKPFDLLLGRKTYEIFAAYWPHHKEGVIGRGIDRATKYVVSHKEMRVTWEKSVLLTNDAVEAIKKLKSQDGPELQVHGSGNLIQTLLRYDLVDEFWLKIFPITLGTGKHLFTKGTIPAAFKVTMSSVSPTGVVIANFERTGEVKTGSF
jgi:dihydrofolate reductase